MSHGLGQNSFISHSLNLYLSLSLSLQAAVLCHLRLRNVLDACSANAKSASLFASPGARLCATLHMRQHQKCYNEEVLDVLLSELNHAL